MPDTLETDPRKGFIALPMSVFDLDLTPGAFRTLAELCRMANLDGICWPSLRQLGDRLGRSRPAISGYIAELREAGLITTETQKMANGYNYRLRYHVTFWKDWRKQLGQPAERRVQQSERPLRTKNHIQENQSPAQAGLDKLVLEWTRLVGRAPYPAFDQWPSETLLKTSRSAPSEAHISADIIRSFECFLSDKGIRSPALDTETKTWLRENVPDQQAEKAFLAAMKDLWKPHWQKPPSLSQLKRLSRSLNLGRGPASKSKLLATYLKRWEIHSQSLSLTPTAVKVAA